MNQVLISCDGKLAVTMSKDCTSRIWDAQTGACLHVLQGRAGQGLGAAQHAECAGLAAGG